MVVEAEKANGGLLAVQLLLLMLLLQLALRFLAPFITPAVKTTPYPGLHLRRWILFTGVNSLVEPQVDSWHEDLLLPLFNEVIVLK